MRATVKKEVETKKQKIYLSSTKCRAEKKKVTIFSIACLRLSLKLLQTITGTSVVCCSFSEKRKKSKRKKNILYVYFNKKYM